MNNVITIEKVNSIYTDVCLSSQADGTNGITIEIYPVNADNPQLKVFLNGTLKSSVNLTNNTYNMVPIDSSLFVSDGEITFAYVEEGSVDIFTIYFPNNLYGNLMVSKTADYTFEARYTVESSGDISDYTVDTISTETADYPEVVAGNKVSVIIGKIKKFLNDLKSKKVDKAGDTMTGKLQANGGISSSGFTASKLLVTDANKNIASGSLAESDLITTSNIGSQSVSHATTAGSADTARAATTANSAGYATSAGSAESVSSSAQASGNAHRPIFFAYVGDNQKICYDTDFQYNPYTDTLEVGSSGKNAKVVIYGTAASNPLTVRGISGSDGSGNIGDLYLNYGINNNTNFGKTGQSYLGTSGSILLAGNCVYAIGSRSKFTDLNTASAVLCANNGGFVRRYDNNNTATVMHASQFAVDSSKLIKENVQNITEEYAKNILKLRPVSFDYIEKVGGEKGQCGMIAEEVLPIYPECVNVPDGYTEEKAIKEIENGNNMMCLSIDYAKFTPYLIKMIQMQQKQIDDMQKEINELKDMIKGR